MIQTQYPSGSSFQRSDILNKKMHLGKFIKISLNKKSYLIHLLFFFSCLGWAGESRMGGLRKGGGGGGCEEERVIDGWRRKGCPERGTAG